jgi:hypothetical protein
VAVRSPLWQQQFNNKKSSTGKQDNTTRKYKLCASSALNNYVLDFKMTEQISAYIMEH